MTNPIQAALAELAALPPLEGPLVSLYVDWTVDGNGQRPAALVATRELERMAAELPDHQDDRASLEADIARIADFLGREAPPDVRGLAIFACHAAGVWHALSLHVAVETSVAIDRMPHLFRLARLLDDYEATAVVVADSQEARILLLAADVMQTAGTTEASETVNRHQAGGWSQARFQRHIENTVRAHTRDLAAELQRVVDRHQVERIVIASNDSVKGSILAELPDRLQAMLLEYMNLDPTSDERTIVAAVEPIVAAAERQQEADIVARLEDQLASRGGLAAAGVPDVAMALSKGQVATLLMLGDFGGPGGECPTCGTLRAGQRTKCPYDGSELLPVELREAFTARVLQQSAELQVVEVSELLAQHAGVAALLRYRDDVERTVGDDIA